ncbi:hypothetical protein FGW37_26760 [Streptomyces rectiverticillatus]|nr:hypothetical protein FGW37_26760 [Streptomyces rectiverticillatus]
MSNSNLILDLFGIVGILATGVGAYVVIRASKEAKTAEGWRGEAEAQKARADRLQEDLTEIKERLKRIGQGNARQMAAIPESMATGGSGGRSGSAPATVARLHVLAERWVERLPVVVGHDVVRLGLRGGCVQPDDEVRDRRDAQRQGCGHLGGFVVDVRVVLVTVPFEVLSGDLHDLHIATAREREAVPPLQPDDDLQRLGEVIGEQPARPFGTREHHRPAAILLSAQEVRPASGFPGDHLQWRT